MLRLTGQRHIEVDGPLADHDYGQLLCDLPEDRCRWVLHTSHPTLITWLPEQASIKERLLYTAANPALRAHLPDTATTV